MKYTFLAALKRVLSIWHWREQAIGLSITILAFAVLGPFGTSELAIMPRFMYWAVDITAGWVLVLVLLAFLLRNPYTDEWPSSVRVGLAVALASLPIGWVVIQVEWAIRGNIVGPIIMLEVFFICALIGGLMNMRVQSRLGLTPKNISPEISNFFKRLPFDLGTDIISLSTQDHYVEVTTAKGSALILVRFSDALEELNNHNGVQIHRSHWVTRGAMRSIKRDAGKLVLELIDGRQLPVSRTYSATVRAVLA